jgi:hypothetical protein
VVKVLKAVFYGTNRSSRENLKAAAITAGLPVLIRQLWHADIASADVLTLVLNLTSQYDPFKVSITF